MAEIGDGRLERGDRLGGLALSTGVVACGIAGFLFGPATIAALAGFWTNLLLPAITAVYIYGVALCT